MQPTRSLRPLYITSAILGALLLLSLGYIVAMQNTYFAGWIGQQCLRITEAGTTCRALFPFPE